MTSSSFFNLSCDSYKQIVFSGFTRLQEQQEFVDLTLAADGHIVKVHKNIMALASPYIKELLKLSSSDSPVIFLNNVKHDVLKYLLEYIYQGEVNLPKDSIESFLQLSQSLHITGMGKLNQSKNNLQADCANQNSGKSIKQQRVQRCPTTLDKTCTHTSHQQPEDVHCWTEASPLKGGKTCKDNESTSNVAASITINDDHRFQVQQLKNIQISNDGDSLFSNSNNDYGQIITAESIQAMPVVEIIDNRVEDPAFEIGIAATSSHDDCPDATVEKEPTNHFPIIQILTDTNENSEETGLIDLNIRTLDEECKDAIKKITQYTFSERGSVQIIVNRYMYSCHHSSRGGRKQRWRCIEYRKKHCRAYIDSLDDRIMIRKGLHDHGFHDDRIYKKHNLGQIFHSYEDAKEAWAPTKTFSDNQFDNEQTIT